MRSRHHRVTPGQRWSILDFRDRITVRVESIADGHANCVVEATGRPRRFTVRTLEYGLRGARPLDDDTRKTQYGARTLGENQTESRTASECVRTFKPHGVATCSDRDREVLRLRDVEGLGPVVIAEKLGMTPRSVDSALRRARDAAEEERNARMNRRTA